MEIELGPFHNSAGKAHFATLFAPNQLTDFEKAEGIVKFKLSNGDNAIVLPENVTVQRQTFYRNESKYAPKTIVSVDDLAKDLEKQAVITPQKKVIRTEEINIVTWNTLKLGCVNDEEGLKTVKSHFENQDIVVLQEIPQASGSERIEKIGMAYKLSTASGKAPDHKRPEYHAMLFNEERGWKVESEHTFERSFLSGMEFDYAPFTCVFTNERLLPGGDKLWITSVHLPPVSRAAQRDEHLKELCKLYIAHIASHESGMDGFHVIAGDFNCHPKEVLNYGFIIGADSTQLTTSEGHKCYDNIVYSPGIKNKFHCALTDTMRTKQNFVFSDHLPVHARFVRDIQE